MIRARATGATCTGCQCRFRTRVGRCSTQPPMRYNLLARSCGSLCSLPGWSAARTSWHNILTDGKGMAPGALRAGTLTGIFSPPRLAFGRRDRQARLRSSPSLAPESRGRSHNGWEPSMRAEIIAIGSELVSGQALDTNSQWLSQQLEALGIPVAFHTILGDDLEDHRAVL